MKAARLTERGGRDGAEEDGGGELGGERKREERRKEGRNQVKYSFKSYALIFKINDKKLHHRFRHD